MVMTVNDINCSSPFILDTDMNLDEDLDQFENQFFDSNLPYDTTATGSPGNALNDGLFDSHHTPAIFASPRGANSKLDVAGEDASVNIRPQAPSLHSSNSPAGSFRDSSSDSSVYNRESSSTSQPSPGTAKDPSGTEMDLVAWPNDEVMGDNDGPAYFNGTIDPSSMSNGFSFTDKSMENDFDFESAASSPSPFNTTIANIGSPDMPIIKHENTNKSSPKLKAKYQHKAKASASDARL